MKPIRDGSEREFARAKRVIPGGVNSPARAFGGVGGTPIVMDRGEGPWLIDVDGNRYLDFIGSWGPLILGHRHPRVMAAVQAQLAKATTFGAPCSAEADLAELVLTRLTSAERVRFTSSGTEAAMSAVRLARGFTGRPGIVKTAGAYHGHVDALLVRAGSAATTLGTPSSPGIPPGATADTHLVEFNDLDGVRRLFAEHPGAIAAVLVEPLPGNMGLVPPLPGYLEGLRELTEREGALLVFDEVMTGFRIAPGGFQETIGVRPDLTILGKVIGGGLPCAAYAGRRAVMETVSPTGPVYQAGTLSGNPLAMAAGQATLSELFEADPYSALAERGRQLAEGLRREAAAAAVPATIHQVGSMLTLFFHPGSIRNYAEATGSDTKAYARFFWGMMDRGFYLPCSQYEALFLSTLHDEELIERTIAAARECLRELG